jgi:gliding motility-associated-like protein
MKNLLFLKGILAFVFALAFQISYAQLQNNHVNKGAVIKPIKNITNVEYKTLKKQGTLSDQYEYIIDHGANMPVASYSINLAKSTTILTQCDPLPVQGSIGYSVETDDTPLLTIPIPFNFCFYGTNYTSLRLSANGNVQFSTNSTAFSSTGFPSSTVNMIAPFWADGESMVSSGGITYGKIYIDPHPTYMIISWDSMGYFNNMVDKLNSFQLVLTNGLDPILPVGKNVGFYYKKMQWTTGGASGGTNGFPTTQPGTPATIGANQGNGIDYFLIGRFGVPGSVYDGPLGNSDGISWLDGKRFFFDVCPPIGTNQSPVSTLIGPCDTIKVCGNDSLIIKNAFIGPELTQSVSITASAPSLGSSFSFTTITTGNSTDINMMVDGSSAPAGYHTVTMSATDNGTPSLTSSQTFLVFVDRTSTNNLNGQIIITPTIGICPGGAASASILTTGGTPSSYLWSDNSAGTSTNFTVTPSLDSTVFVTLKFGQCQKTIKNYIHVKPVPVASITGNTSLCSGTNSTTVLTASNTLNTAAQAPYTYTWAGSPAPSPTNTQTTTASGGTYSVTITNKYNCSASTVITVNLATTPMFTVVPTNTTICSNGAVPLSLTFGNGAPACGLSTSGGCTSPNNIQVGSATTQGSGSVYTPYGGLFESARNQYLFRASELIAAGISPGKIDKLAFNVTNLNGNANSFENFTIKIKCVTYSVVSTTSMDNTGLIQVYGPQTINASVGWNTYNFTQAYEWDGVSNLLVDICFFNQNWDGNISVQYTNVGFTSTKYVNADNNDQCPVTTVDGTDVNRPNVRFGNCPSTPAASAFTYSWSPATGLSSTSVSNPTANISASIQYSVIVTPTAAPTCSNVGTTSLTIITPATPTITAVSALCSNAPNFTLTGLPTGGTWSLTASTSTAGVFTPSLAAIGNNTVTYLYGGAGCLQTTTAIVPIERYVPSTITGTINPICLPGSTVNLSTALTTSTLGVGTWSGNGVTGTTFNPISAGVGTHTLTYSTNSVPTIALCPTFSTIAVTVNSAIQPTISAIGPFCTNTPSVVISASPTGGTWAASPGVNTAGAFTPSLALIGNNTYTYTVGASACSATNTITIAVEQFVPSTITGAINALCITNQPINLSTALGTSPLGVGVWSGNGVTGAMFDPNVAGAGTHTLTYSTNSVPTTALCPDASTIEVTVNSVVQPTITATGPFCDNFTAQQLVANPNGGVWSAGTIGTNVSTAGLLSPGSSLLGPNKILYTLTNAPCVKQDSINVTIIHFIPATITGALGPYCNYDAPVNLQPTAQFTGGVWSGAGVNGSSFNPTTAGAGVHPITYSTEPAPGNLCGDSKTLTIVVNPKPEANAVPDATVGCNPVTINYSTNTVNTGTAIWDFGDGSPRETGLIFTHIYSSPGTYTATLYYTDLNGCKDTATAVNGITVNALPVASFNPSLIQTTVIDGQVEFTNQSTVLGNNTYEWNIGDGMYTSNNINESYLFSNSGNFVVTLFATTAEGCVDDTSLVIVVNPDVVLYVPNAFTPGVDGLNDVFQIFLPPSGVDYSTFHLTIFNRWGELIYQTNDVNESWTGAKNNSGPILKQDTYIYKIEFQDERKKHYEKTGHVSLLRK